MLNSAAYIVLLVLVISAESSPASETQRFQEGDFVVVRGRLAECVELGLRLVEMRRVEDSRPLPLLGLPAVSILGRTESEVASDVRARYREAIPTGAMPPIEIKLARGKAGIYELVNDYRLSAGLWKFTGCMRDPLDLNTTPLPPPPWADDYDFPPPGISEVFKHLSRRCFRQDVVNG